MNALSSSVEALPPPVSSRDDSHVIRRFTEQSDPILAVVAQRIHAEGYENMGFIKSSAVTEQGKLDVTIDKARGDNVDYFLASNHDIEDLRELSYDDAATLRKFNLMPGQDVTSLPAYGLCQDALYNDEHEFLLSIDQPDKYLKEISALARTPQAKPIAVFELLRDAFQGAHRNNEVWFFSIVSSTYDILAASFGPEAIRKVGDPVKIGDDRVADGVQLVPAVVETQYFLERVCVAVHSEEDAMAKRRLAGSLVFFCEGIRDQDLTDSVLMTRNAILEGKKR